MYQKLTELLLPVLELGIYVVAAALFAAVGLLFEYQSYLFLTGGELLVGAWAAGFGLILLAASYRITTDKLTPPYRASSSSE